jgi:hypothetical protein
MSEQPKNFAALFRAKAEEARTIAESMANTSARATVLKVAAAWEQLAEQEEKAPKKFIPRSN